MKKNKKFSVSISVTKPKKFTTRTNTKSAARLAHHFRLVGAAGSNPVIPTIKSRRVSVGFFISIESNKV